MLLTASIALTTSPWNNPAACTRASCLPRPPPLRAWDARSRASPESSPRRCSTSCRPTAGSAGPVPLVVFARDLDRVREALEADLLEPLFREAEVLQRPPHLLAGERLVAELRHRGAVHLDVVHALDEAAIVERF